MVHNIYKTKTIIINYEIVFIVELMINFLVHIWWAKSSSGRFARVCIHLTNVWLSEYANTIEIPPTNIEQINETSINGVHQL